VTTTKALSNFGKLYLAFHPLIVLPFLGPKYSSNWLQPMDIEKYLTTLNRKVYLLVYSDSLSIPKKSQS
jgi:hypothetical protein